MIYKINFKNIKKWVSLCGSAGKESACNEGDLGLIPGFGWFPGDGKGYPLQYSGPENFMDCIVHGIAKIQTWLSDFHFHFTFHKINIFLKMCKNKNAPTNWISKGVKMKSGQYRWEANQNLHWSISIKLEYFYCMRKESWPSPLLLLGNSLNINTLHQVQSETGRTCTNNKMAPQTGPQGPDIILHLFLKKFPENPQDGDLNTILLCEFGYV